MLRIGSISLLVILFFIAACELRCETPTQTNLECENKTKDQTEFCSLVWVLVKEWKQGLWKSKSPWLHWVEMRISIQLSPHKPQLRISAQSPGRPGLNISMEKKKSAFLSAKAVFKEFLDYIERNLIDFSPNL